MLISVLIFLRKINKQIKKITLAIFSHFLSVFSLVIAVFSLLVSLIWAFFVVLGRSKLVLIILNILVYSLEKLCSHYQKKHFQKRGLRPKWTIYKHESYKNKKYLSVGNLGILSVVIVCLYRVYSLHLLMQWPEIFTQNTIFYSRLL